MDKKFLQILTFSMLTTSILYPSILAFAMHEEGLDSCYAQLCDTEFSNPLGGGGIQGSPSGA
jgi:hypothetical protein